jgi:hypothetical protein
MVTVEFGTFEVTYTVSSPPSPGVGSLTDAEQVLAGGGGGGGVCTGTGVAVGAGVGVAVKVGVGVTLGVGATVCAADGVGPGVVIATPPPAPGEESGPIGVDSALGWLTPFDWLLDTSA